MRAYSPKKYIDLVERSNVSLLKEFMNDEKKFLLQVNKINTKKIIDLGAGYGRIIPYINNKIEYYWGIDINNEMFSELKVREEKFNNIKAIKGDFTKLRNIITKENVDIDNSLFLLFQNTIGTIEGNLDDLLSELKIILQNNSTELIISFFRSSKLFDLGLEMFFEITDMVGEPDIDKCDFSNGVFRSKVGYEAKWWSDDEISNIINFLELDIISTLERDAYKIYHLKS